MAIIFLKYDKHVTARVFFVFPKETAKYTKLLKEKGGFGDNLCEGDHRLPLSRSPESEPEVPTGRSRVVDQKLSIRVLIRAGVQFHWAKCGEHPCRAQDR